MDRLILEFSELNEVEQLLANDDLNEFKKIDITYTQEMTELCAFFGSVKCLIFLEEQGVEITPLINLYAIMHGLYLPINIPHEDELLACLKYQRLDRIKEIEKPDIKHAVKALLYAFNECLMIDVDYPLLIYQLYDEDEWRKVIRGKALIEIVKHNHPIILPNVKLGSREFLAMLRDGNEIPDDRLPSVCIFDSGEVNLIKDWVNKVVCVPSKQGKVRLS